MNEKQKLKSLRLKMARIEKNNPEIDFKFVSQKFFEIEKYYKLRQEHFFLEFEMEHCATCGKKI
jgi:hypothetical protein